jgi:ribosomal subunit interface protein
MDIQISGKKIDIGAALREHVSDKLNVGVTKYFDRPVDAHVAFAREGQNFKCDVSVHLSSGISLQASGQSGDIYSAFDVADDRLATRLRRYKRRLKDHHNSNKEPIQAMMAHSYVIQPDDDAQEEPEGLQPVIIAEDTTHIKTLSVGEAVMQMDLQEAPVLLFKNAVSDGLNMVYRRPDGNIGWVDPQNGIAKQAS